MANQKIPASLRLPDWERRLFELIEANKTRHFVWGEFDCAVWGAMCREAITGLESKANNRKRKTERGAAKIMLAGGGLATIVSSELGEPVNTKTARRGDICMMKHDGRTTIGVCVGSFAMCPSMTGLVPVDMNMAVAAWHI